MLGLNGLFFGLSKRNDPIRLVDPHPVPRYEDNTETGRPGRDGFTLLSKADPNWQGSPPDVSGTVGRTHRGPDESFEQ